MDRKLIVIFIPLLLYINYVLAFHPDIKSDYEFISIPTQLYNDYDSVVYYNITAFGTSITLNLKPNNNLVAPNFKILVNNDDQEEYVYNNDKNPIDTNCYYIHSDANSIAAFNLCQTKSVSGLILLENSILEINPILHNSQIQEEALLFEDIVDNSQQMLTHAVKRTPFAKRVFDDSIPFQFDQYVTERLMKRNNGVSNSKITIELALFFDEAAFKLFAPYFKYDEKRIANMLLAYINGVQALYHHPSLGRSVDIVLVRLEIMKRQPNDLPHYNGERTKLLDSFCDYQKRKNLGTDSTPEHWDMALYVSGLDFFAYENGRKSTVTMGLATVAGVCLEQFNCVIAELGTTNVFGKPYPSAGFTSVFIAAHEIGHNLGMHHDGSGNNCPKDGYIMSPSRGTAGETIWSYCSAEIMNKLTSFATCLLDKPGKHPSNLNHNKYLGTPGQKFGGKKQCEILLRDKDAVVSTNQKSTDICYNLQCKTPHRSGYYHAGPALEGTECGKGKWCQGGNCVKAVKQKPMKIIPGGWSPWKPDKCSSGCLTKSKGFQNRYRECNNPKPLNTDEGCEGSSYDTVLCNDSNLCNKRPSPVSYASLKCQEFSKLIKELDPNGAGLQAPHEIARPWMGCAIFCRRADSGGYYTPRFELNDLNVSPYFPDGTWCHNDNNVNYYCLHHHCLPENFQFTKTSILDGIGEDIPIVQNANPSQTVPPELQSYYSLDSSGNPLQTSFNPELIKPEPEHEWETKDYLEISAFDDNNL